MFDVCALINKICPHCTHSNINLKTGKKDSVTREYCGMISGGDTTTAQLKECWLKMNNYQRTKHRKTTL